MDGGKFVCVKCFMRRGKDVILVMNGKACCATHAWTRGLKGRMFVFVKVSL